MPSPENTTYDSWQQAELSVISTEELLNRAEVLRTEEYREKDYDEYRRLIGREILRRIERGAIQI